jgi:N-acetylmuramoyl-L-alanine amidase CwlA
MILIGILYLIGYHFFIPKIQSEAKIRYVGDIPVYEDIIPEDAAGRVMMQREIKYIVIHETGNITEGADAAAHNSFIHSNSLENEHSWHYTVDDEKIYHHVPDIEPAYHAGDHLDRNGGNLNGIGIEICVAADNDYDQTIDNAALLAARLMVEYDLIPERALKKHQDFSGKYCPQNMLDQNRWTDFAQQVSTYYNEISS